MSPGAHGGTIATADGHSIELIEIQPVRAHVGDVEAWANVLVDTEEGEEEEDDEEEEEDD